MNADRRQVGQVLIALLVECSHTGLISDESHLAATGALHHLQRQEFHQLRSQEKYDGTSPSNTKQVAICRVAGQALEEAVTAWDNDDFDTVITKLTLAVETDGTVPKPRRRRNHD